MIQLKRVPVIFREADHTYWFGDKRLFGTSHLYGNHINPSKYSGIKQSVLEAAAKRGTLVHEQCEEYDRFGIVSGDEADNWAKMRVMNEIAILENEYLISDLEYFATKIDKVMWVGEPSEFVVDLGDVKTTSELDKEALSWQLSVSAYLFEQQNPDVKVRNLYGIWLRGKKAKLQPVERKPDEVVRALMEAEMGGYIYTPQEQPNDLPIEIQNQLQKVTELESFIQQQTEQLKQKQADMETLKAYLMQQMASNGIKKIDGEQVTITYVDAYTKELFDSKRFKEEQPDLAEKYIKQSQVKETIKIKLK